MGLSGLLIWAIDLDAGNLEALRAVSDSSMLDGITTPFTLVDLDRLFPLGLLPPEDITTNYGLINFGARTHSGETDPNQTGFGFILVTGDSYAVSSLKKREGEPEPLVFLDCPSDVLERPINQTQRARVVCLSDDVKGCFQVMERGVEGTIVEMPDNVSALPSPSKAQL